MGKGGVYAGGGSGEIVGGSSGAYESDNDSDWSGSELSAYSAMGSIERQMQQDTFFELDETLWRVVPRREVRMLSSLQADHVFSFSYVWGCAGEGGKAS